MSDDLNHTAKDQWCPWQGGRCFDVRCDACPNRIEIYKPKDNVTLPGHYARFKIEPIRFITENKLDFFQGNIVKYVCRHDAKNGREDLNKAKRYLEMYIKYLDGDPDFWKK